VDYFAEIGVRSNQLHKRYSLRPGCETVTGGFRSRILNRNIHFSHYRHTKLRRREPSIGLPTDPSFTMPLPGTNDVGDAGYCPFSVTVQVFSDQNVTNTPLPNGGLEQRFTGHAKAIVTRDDDPRKSITYNISGPGTQTFTTAARDASFTIDAAGPNLLWTTRGNSAPAGVLQLAYTTGRVQLAVNNTGHTDSYQLNGHSTDVCAKLAA
jgi:hypothetical protein